MTKLAKQIKKRTTSTKSIWKKTIPFRGYNIYWWVYPIGVVSVLIHERHIRHYASLKWDEKKAKEMADRYFGKVCDIDEEGLWFCEACSDHCFVRHARRRDRAWLTRYGYHMKVYIFDTYEIAGYEKRINPYNCSDNWVLFSKVGA